jgi:dTDP-4-amino-4,6-dideoxygalactose transaminase
MQFIDLTAQQKLIREKIEENIKNVLDHGRYIMGPEVGEIEKRLSHYVNVENAIGVSSGTEALLIALMAFDIGPGDAVFTTPFTFIATAEVICLLGATPVFVDIDPRTFNIDPDNLEMAIKAVENADPSIYPVPGISAKSLAARGIIGVDLFGLPAEYERINSLAKEKGLFVIEDAAQSFGAECNDKKACSLSEIACTSFFPAKPLGCYGDGGMCFTASEELAGKMRSIRIHGKGSGKYDNVRTGINGRLDTIQAAVLLAKMEIFEDEVEKRQEVATRYKDLLSEYEEINPPSVPPNMKSAWAQYSVLAKDGDKKALFQARLKDAGIPTAVYYPKPLHLQTAFAYLSYREGEFPASESISKRIFSLPFHPYLREEQQESIVAAMFG